MASPVSSEDLVPKGLPQGARQENVAAFKAAGLPLGSQGAAPEAAAPPVAGAPPAGPTVDARQGMQGFDVFADREPSTPPAPSRRDVLFEQVRRSDNAVLRDIYSRVPGFKED